MTPLRWQNVSRETDEQGQRLVVIGCEESGALYISVNLLSLYIPSLHSRICSTNWKYLHNNPTLLWLMLHLSLFLFFSAWVCVCVFLCGPIHCNWTSWQLPWLCQWKWVSHVINPNHSERWSEVEQFRLSAAWSQDLKSIIPSSQQRASYCPPVAKVCILHFNCFISSGIKVKNHELYYLDSL